MTTRTRRSSPERPPSHASSEGFESVSRAPGGPLERLLDHIRSLLQVDGVAFLVAVGDGRLERAAGWFATAELREAMAPAARRERPGLAELALERDRPLVLPSVEAWEAAPRLRAGLTDALGDVHGADVWESFRTASVIACPVKTAIGRPLGVLVAASAEGGALLDTDAVRIVDVLADVSAIAVERASVLEEEARRARDELRLYRASEDASASLDPEEVCRRIAKHAAGITGASKALLSRLEPGGNALEVAARIGFGGLTSDLIPTGRGMLGQVVTTRRPYRSEAADTELFDLSLVEGEQIGSFMHAPIELGPRLFGVLSVAHEERERFGRPELDLLVRFARSSAGALANAMDHQHERRTAKALTQGFVPESLPEISGYEFGLLFDPQGGQPVGGDLYGAWRLPGGEVAVLVGDVAGKGLETAALGAMARFFVEARTWDSPLPSIVLAQANAMLQGRLPSDTFVTAFLGVLDGDRLRYASAGHLPPLLVRDGQVTQLTAHGLALGIEPASAYRDEEVRMDAGDLLFAYTDGLVEGRREGRLYGIERLAGLVAEHAAALPPQRLVRAMHDDVRGWADSTGDDTVALALRRLS